MAPKHVLGATGVAGVCVGLLLAIQAAMLAWSSSRHSPSIDEVAHMAAGMSRWYFGRFDIYRVNPPLPSTVATLPVFLSNPRTNWEGWGIDIRPEWHIGMRFMEENGPKAFWYFTLARWGCIPLILLGGYFCYRWATELWGRASGFVALLLWTFSPTVLGNGAMITPDTTAASMGVVAHYAFWRWLKRHPGGARFSRGLLSGWPNSRSRHGSFCSASGRQSGSLGISLCVTRFRQRHGVTSSANLF